MKKTIIKVPYGIKYISEWKDYKLPQGKCIVDKGVTGCGYTEFCLTNSDNVILCSPRKLLLENKSDQHKKKGNINVLYLENDFKKGQKDINVSKSLKQQIRNHILFCQGTPFTQSYPIKILVTYDSVHYVVDVLKEYGLLDKFTFVVDEFQSVFLDAFFKASTEFDFVESLQECVNVLHLSATPMLEKYLMLVDEFKDLDYYELDWSETGLVETVKITRKKFYDSINKVCSKIIENFKLGNYPTTLDSLGNPIQSKEAVFYINSIGDIIRIIKTTKLNPWEVNIICSKDDKNKKKLKDLSKELKVCSEFEIGKVPLEGETNKMFTFCTRAVYVGADFHSSCASTYIFADPNVKSLALDISLDLPQIVGRQRDRENPFKNEVTLFYKTTHKIQTREEFKEEQSERIKSTEIILNLFEKANKEEKAKYLKKLRSDIQVSQYSEDFVSISSKTGLPVHNKFIELSYERAWEVSQKDYQDNINVTKAIEGVDIFLSVSQEEKDRKIFEEFKGDFDSTNVFAKKLETYCKYMDMSSGNFYLQDLLSGYTSYVNYRKFYDFYGTKGCKAKEYREKDLESGMFAQSILYSEKEFIIKEFSVGERYTNSFFKQKLSEIYKILNISKVAKAKDIQEYFETERTRIKNQETGKLEEGLRLLSLKSLG